MRIFAAAAGFACILLLVSGGLAQAPTATQIAQTFAVEQVAIGAPGQRMNLVIWRPAALVAGTAAGASGKKFPLVVISHGTGAGPTAHIDTAQALASAGFVVAAPMHPGDNFQDDSSVGRPEWMANRSRDVSSTIDYLLNEWPGRAQVNGKRVGIFGLSAGATTALISLGGIPDLARLAPHCAAHPEFVCKIIPPQADPGGASPPHWTHDSRVTAAVIAAPGLGFLFEPAGLSKVRAPIQLWVGSEDDTVPYETNAAVVRRLLPHSPDFHRVEGAVHLSFLAPCTPESPPQICQDRKGFDRAAFHQKFNRSVVDFFRLHLEQ
jgi:predicted dienelactone hydrolase